MPKNISGVLYEQAPRLTMTVMLFEKGSQILGTGSDAVAEWFTQTWGYTQESAAKFWHGTGKVFAFCDGHVKYFAYPSGPFKYDYNSFSGWSNHTSAPSPSGAGVGYCGWADNLNAGGVQFSPNGNTNLPGADIPQ